MCKQGDTVPVYVTIPADLSTTGEVQAKCAEIDRCIAPIVSALQRAGIDMRGSCCGHGKGLGDIHLQDGRLLLILDQAEATRYLTDRRPGRTLLWTYQPERWGIPTRTPPPHDPYC